MTVGDLINMLQQLPPDAPIWILYFCTEGKASLPDDFGLFVYKRDDDIKLVFNDGQATHPEFDDWLRPVDEVKENGSTK